MQYMILIYGDEKGFAKLSEAEQGRVYGEYMEYSKKLATDKVLKGGASLKDLSTASTVPRMASVFSRSR